MAHTPKRMGITSFIADLPNVMSQAFTTDKDFTIRYGRNQLFKLTKFSPDNALKGVAFTYKINTTVEHLHKQFQLAKTSYRGGLAVLELECDKDKVYLYHDMEYASPLFITIFHYQQLKLSAKDLEIADLEMRLNAAKAKLQDMEEILASTCPEAAVNLKNAYWHDMYVDLHGSYLQMQSQNKDIAMLNAYVRIIEKEKAELVTDLENVKTETAELQTALETAVQKAQISQSKLDRIRAILDEEEDVTEVATSEPLVEDDEISEV